MYNLAIAPLTATLADQHEPSVSRTSQCLTMLHNASTYITVDPCSDHRSMLASTTCCCCRYTTWSCHAFIPLHLLFITDGADDHAADTHAHVHDDDDA